MSVSTTTQSIPIESLKKIISNQHVMLFAFSCLCLSTAFADTWLVLMAKYKSSGTYAHGFLVVPISLWMMWQKRDLVNENPMRFESKALYALIACALVWFSAELALVGIVQQLMVITMLITCFVMCFGRHLSKAFIFPLSYLFFAVPFGNFMIPTLQDWTAVFAVKALELSGIVVYYEGWQIATSAGDFEVAEACSGIRYLIATLALGVMFSYVTYEKWSKRLLFCLCCVIIPLLANGIRAYLIILIAHFSKMKYAVGVDHLIYGWLFFGVIIFLLLAMGSLWRDPIKQPSPVLLSKLQAKPIDGIWLKVCVIGLTMMFAPLLSNWTLNRNVELESVQNQWPSDPNANWQFSSTTDKSWGPLFSGSNFESYQSFALGSRKIDGYVALYFNQSKGNELISERNHFYNRKTWSLLGSEKLYLDKDKRFEVIELDIQHKSKRRLVWYVYVISGVPTVNPVWGKILEGFSWIQLTKKPGGVIVLSSEYEYTPDSARESLQQFAEAMGQPLLTTFFKHDI